MDAQAEWQYGRSAHSSPATGAPGRTVEPGLVAPGVWVSPLTASQTVPLASRRPGRDGAGRRPFARASSHRRRRTRWVGERILGAVGGPEDALAARPRRPPPGALPGWRGRGSTVTSRLASSGTGSVSPSGNGRDLGPVGGDAGPRGVPGLSQVRISGSSRAAKCPAPACCRGPARRRRTGPGTWCSGRASRGRGPERLLRQRPQIHARLGKVGVQADAVVVAVRDAVWGSVRWLQGMPTIRHAGRLASADSAG